MKLLSLSLIGDLVSDFSLSSPNWKERALRAEEAIRKQEAEIHELKQITARKICPNCKKLKQELALAKEELKDVEDALAETIGYPR